MSVEIFTNGESRVATEVHRPIWPAIRRGLRCRCPACGEGPLFIGFLKTVEACPNCGEVIGHHRADDLPAYLTIVVVGHIVVPLVLWMEKTWHPDVLFQLGISIPLTLALTFALIRPIKGAVVALQWANRMHGFGGADDERDAAIVTGRGSLGAS